MTIDKFGRKYRPYERKDKIVQLPQVLDLSYYFYDTILTFYAKDTMINGEYELFDHFSTYTFPLDFATIKSIPLYQPLSLIVVINNKNYKVSELEGVNLNKGDSLKIVRGSVVSKGIPLLLHVVIKCKIYK